MDFDPNFTGTVRISEDTAHFNFTEAQLGSLTDEHVERIFARSVRLARNMNLRWVVFTGALEYALDLDAEDAHQLAA